jgi:hypothetical protein
MFTLADGGLADPSAAIPGAIERCASRMVEPPLGEYEGLPALRRFAAEVGDWPEATEDWRWCARFNYQVIERRGTGGGNFRRMYAAFLRETGRDESRLAAAAAERWSALAESLRDASEGEDPDRAAWAAVSERAASVLRSEERLWESLAAAPVPAA